MTRKFSDLNIILSVTHADHLAVRKPDSGDTCRPDRADM